MAKYCGKVGYGMTVEKAKGVFVVETQERTYYGDVLDDVRKWEKGEDLNDDLNIMNKISILADAFAYENLDAIRYAEFMGVKWKVKSVSVVYPRLTLSLGGVYHEFETGVTGKA